MIQATPTSISVVTDCSMRLCFVYGWDYYGYGYFTSSIFFFVRKTRAVYTHFHSLARLQVGVPSAPHTHGGLPNEGYVHMWPRTTKRAPHADTAHSGGHMRECSAHHPRRAGSVRQDGRARCPGRRAGAHLTSSRPAAVLAVPPRALTLASKPRPRRLMLLFRLSGSRNSKHKRRHGDGGTRQQRGASVRGQGRALGRCSGCGCGRRWRRLQRQVAANILKQATI